MPPKPVPSKRGFGPRDLSREEIVGISGEIMDPTGCLVRANFDPGLFCERKFESDYLGVEGEPLHQWQARAGIEALIIAGHLPEEARRDA